MSSFDNPFLMAAAQAVPHQQIINQYSRMAPLRIAENLTNNAMRESRMYPMRAPGMPRGSGYSGPGQITQEGLDPNVFFNPEFRDQANQLLSPYGLSLPEYQGPNAFLPNSGFFGNHPRISGAIEGALLGAANTRPAYSIGEGISNAIVGGLSAQGQRASMIANRYMAPFAAAGQLEKLADMQGQRELRDAQIQNMQDRSANQATANYYKFLEQQARDQQRQEDSNPWAFHFRGTDAQGNEVEYGQPKRGGSPVPLAPGVPRQSGNMEERILQGRWDQMPDAQKKKFGSYENFAWGELRSMRAIGANTSQSSADDRQRRSQIYAESKDVMSSMLWPEKGRPQDYMSYGLDDPTKGPALAKEHNAQIKSLHSDWTDAWERGETGMSFKDWFNMKQGKGKPTPTTTPQNPASQTSASPNPSKGVTVKIAGTDVTF